MTRTTEDTAHVVQLRASAEASNIELQASGGDPRRAFVSLAQFCGILALLWLGFYGLYKTLPFVRSGAEAIYQAKVKLLSRGLDAELVIFGNSKVLSGFVPSTFDIISGLRSYNLGLPDEQRFIDNLEKLAAHGRAPRFVLLTMTRSFAEQPLSIFRYLKDDRDIMDRLFPFRHFPRDLVLFLLRSRTRGGPAAFYQASEKTVGQMQTDRGYYFIEGQSHYPDHRLPAGFHVPSDRPDFVNARDRLKPADLARLRSLAERYSIQIWFVPSYFRPGEYAPPPAENPDLKAMVRASPHFHLAGPDYWILPLECFADGAHLNPVGAREYTRRLSGLLSPAIRN